MTSASARLLPASPLTALRRWRAPVGLLLALATVIGARRWAAMAGLDALVVGTAFGLALAAVVLAGRSRGRGEAEVVAPEGRADGWRRDPILAMAGRLAIGAAFGVALVAIVLAGSAIAGTSVPSGMGRPAVPFLPWATITILVATAEEALLRGRLFDVTRRAGGVGLAVVLTTVAFALMHVPIYGWHVVPLDLAVGLGLGGLRLVTGGIAAPSAAHVVADLATWWL